MKYIKTYENFLGKIGHFMIGSKPAEKELSILKDAFLKFLKNIVPISKDFKILGKYHTKEEGRGNLNSTYCMIEIFHKMENVGKSWFNSKFPGKLGFDLIELNYCERNIPPELSTEYFGSFKNTTTKVNFISIDMFFYNLQMLQILNVDSMNIQNFLIEVFNKYSFKKYSDQVYVEIPIENIPALIKDLNADDFEFFMNVKKYNL